MSRRKLGLFKGHLSGEPPVVALTSFSGEDNKGYVNHEDGGDTGVSDTVSPISIISNNSHVPNGAKLGNGLPDGTGVLPSSDEPTPNGNGIPGLRKQVSTVEMKKSINLLHCTAIMVAVTGHSSIFVSPSSILAQTGSIGASLLVWLIGGLINVGTALCFAELGTMYPKAGGPYSYAMKSFGPLMGFLMMWGYTVLIAGPFWAFLANTAALYIVKPAFPDCLADDVKTAVNILAGWIM
ncbi:unnamed protein product, partial [Lymnaea stagnalis]